MKFNNSYYFDGKIIFFYLNEYERRLKKPISPKNENE